MLKAIIYIIIGITGFYIAGKWNESNQRKIAKDALKEHEKEKANDKSRE